MKFGNIILLLSLILVLQIEDFPQVSVPGYDNFIPPPQLDPTNANIVSP